MRRGPGILATLIVLLAAIPAAAGEPDWFTRVERDGLAKASQVEVERHEKGVLPDSLHVGECYYNLERWAEGVAVFERLLRSRDRNYAAAALSRVGEGQYHLSRPAEAEKTFRRCLAEFPDAWLDGSVSERCRAWLDKLAGKLVTPERLEEEDGKAKGEIDGVREEIRELSERIEELKRLLRELDGK
jgi:tetratricopeptide (TPR) repeat protein